jgi:WD40 repeat protein
MALPLLGTQPWHDTYEWVWCPQAPPSAAPSESSASPLSVDLGFGASPTAGGGGGGSPDSAGSRNSSMVPEPAATQARPERAPVHARTNRTFQLDRVIGNSSAQSGSLAWGKDCESLVFPCERAVVTMAVNSGKQPGAEDINAQRFIMGRHTACVNLVTVSNDRTLLVSSQGGRDARVCLWDLARRKWLCDLHGHVSHVASTCFSADDVHLCTVGRDAQHRCQIIVWDVAALRSGRGVGMGPGTVATNLAIVARQISDFHMNRIKFNPADSTVR